MAKLHVLLFFVLGLSICGSEAAAATCPEESALIAGCSCFQNRRLDSLPELRCTSGNRETDLAELIRRLNENAQGSIHHFESLHWTGGKKVEIGEGFFGNVTFRELLLGTPEQFSFISRVHPKAFSSSGPIAEQLRHFAIRSLELRHDADLYQAITSLKKLEYLVVEGRYLTKVPAHAFTPLADCYSVEGCGLKELKRINFSEGWYETIIHVTRLEQFAFAGLPALEEINLKQQDVLYIGDYAFALSSPATSEKPLLKIDLSHQWNAKFKPQSFQPLSLADIGRPVELDLYGNPFLEFLPETVFRPFLEANDGGPNVIRLGQTMTCNCTMKWLWESPQKYRQHFIPWTWTDKSGDDGREHTIQCSETEDLWDLDGTQFEGCDESFEKKEEKEHISPAAPILLDTKDEL